MKIYLVEPEAQGRVSGGYLYNRRLGEASDAIVVVSTTAGSLDRSLAALALELDDWLLLDSLFLEPEAFAKFAGARRGTGCRLGLMLHAFPSFIERADRADRIALIDPRPAASELALLEQLDVVVCPGPYGPRVLRQSGIETPTVSCPPGSPIVHPLPSRPPATPRKVLTVGNVTPGKGYQDALDALRQCGDLDWCWHIVGSLDWDPHWVAELALRARAAGVDTRMKFLGQLSSEAVAQRYLASDVFLLASFTENHPLVLLEARAHGLPIVGYRVGGVPDIVADGGLLASPFDVVELGALLRRVLSDAAEQLRLRDLALRAASERTEWSDSAKGLYQRLLGVVRRPRPH